MNDIARSAPERIADATERSEAPSTAPARTQCVAEEKVQAPEHPKPAHGRHVPGGPDVRGAGSTVRCRDATDPDLARVGSEAPGPTP